MASNTNFIVYTGNGQPGVWNDPANWVNGNVPGPTDNAFIGQSAVLNGPIAVQLLMLLGHETVTIHGALQTNSTNTCESFMVCAGAVANFTAGSTLNDAGGLECGVNSNGNINVAAASGGNAAAVINTRVVKIGQFSGGSGTVNVAGVLNSSGNVSVGTVGQGTLNFTGTGVGNLSGGIVVGDCSGGVGTLSLSGSSVVHADYVTIGSSVGAGPGGTGTAVVGTGALLASTHVVAVGYGSTVDMTGGTLSAGSAGNGMQIKQGGTITGYGTLTCAAVGVTDNGVVASAGGTLNVVGNLTGVGAMDVGANSTLNLVASRINMPSITFMGSGGTLGLVEGVGGTFAIAGFAAGDSIVIPNIDAVSWSGASDVLSVSDHGHIMDKLTLTGVSASAAFLVTPDSHGSIITLLPANAGGLHH